VIEDFLDKPEDFRAEFEERQRAEWNRRLHGDQPKETTETLATLAEERQETQIYEAVGPARYARYVTWRQTIHSPIRDETGRIRNVLEVARGEALPSQESQFEELRGILGDSGYEIWLNRPRPGKAEIEETRDEHDP